jgi:AcrR family transcriptional regulator
MSYRQPILDAALVLFAERGFSGTSVAELAKITGAAEGTIFHHFKNKEGLFLALLEHVRATFVDAVERLRQEARFDSGLELFEATVSLFLLLSETHPRELKILFLGYTHKLATVNPTCREHLEAIYQTFAEAMAEAIELGMRDGSVRPVHAESQALLILSMLSGVVRFRTFGLWTSNRSYSDALEFCHRALEAVEEGVTP